MFVDKQEIIEYLIVNPYNQPVLIKEIRFSLPPYIEIIDCPYEINKNTIILNYELKRFETLIFHVVIKAKRCGRYKIIPTLVYVIGDKTEISNLGEKIIYIVKPPIIRFLADMEYLKENCYLIKEGSLKKIFIEIENENEIPIVLRKIMGFSQFFIKIRNDNINDEINMNKEIEPWGMKRFVFTIYGKKSGSDIWKLRFYFSVMGRTFVSALPPIKISVVGKKEIFQEKKYISEQLIIGSPIIKTTKHVKSIFVNREKEINFLINVAKKVTRRRKGSIVIIRGPAGIGKTRLLEEFMDKMKEKAIILYSQGGAFKRQMIEPFSGIIEGLLSNDQTAGLYDLFSGIMHHGIFIQPTGRVSVLQQIALPATKLETFSNVIISPNLAGFFSSLSEALLRMSQNRLVIWAVDDFFNIDPAAMIFFLFYLLPYINAGSLLFIISARISDIPNWFYYYLTTLRTNLIDIQILDLRPLDTESAKKLLRIFIDIGGELLNRLIKMCRGNPLCISMIGRTLIEGGDPTVCLDAIEELIKSNINRSPYKAQLLELAILGDKFNEEIYLCFKQKLGHRITFPEMISILNDLENAGYIKRYRDHYRFAHQLYRKVALKMIPKGFRLQLLRIAADCLEKHGLYYEAFEKYRATKDLRKAVENLIKAAEKAYKTGLLSEAKRILKRAKEYVEKTGDIELMIRVLIKMGWTSFLMGNLNEAEQLFEKAKKLAHENNFIRYIGEAALGLCFTLTETEKIQKALENGKLAKGIFSRLNDKFHLGMTLFRLGIIFHILGDVAKAEKLYNETLSLGTKLEAQGEILKAMAYHQLGMIMQEKRRLKKALELYEKELDIVRKLGDKYREGQTLHRIAGVFCSLGDVKKAEELFKAAEQIFRKLSGYYSLSFTLSALANLCLKMKRYEEAKNYAEEGLQIAIKGHHDLGIVRNLLALSRVYSTLGDLDKSEELCKEALKIAKKIGHKVRIMNTLLMFAEIYEKRNRFEKSLKYALQALEVVKDHPIRLYSARVLEYIAKLLLKLNKEKEARKYEEEARSIYKEYEKIQW